MNVAAGRVRIPARKIYLDASCERYCIVDAEDYPWLIEHMWNIGRRGRRNGKTSKDYAKRNVGSSRMTIWMHRAIMMRHDPRPESCLIVDHRNRQTLFNCKINLRWLTQGENNRNAKVLMPSLDWCWNNLCVDAGLGIEVPFP
jgi:hypothetical protein